MGSTEIAQAPPKPPIPFRNGVMAPDKWTLFARLANTVANTDFAPKGLRGSPESIMACLVYGDSLGIHPSVALKEVYMVDGKPGISGALMIAMIRRDGHKLSFKTLRDEQGNFVGSVCHGKRMVYKVVNRKTVGEVDEEDEWQFTLDDATRAGLYPATSDKAAWRKYPEVMCRWRAVAQLARFLFPDVFAGGAVYIPDEVDEAYYSERAIKNGSPVASVEGDDATDYGDDPDLAAWLIALFAAANEIEPGRFLSKKVKLLLKDKTQDERATLAIEIAEWIAEQGVDPPSKPNTPEAAEEVDGELVVDEGVG